MCSTWIATVLHYKPPPNCGLLLTYQRLQKQSRERLQTLNAYELSDRSNNTYVMSHIGNGIVYLILSDFTEEQIGLLANTLTVLRKQAVNIQGNLILEIAPLGLKNLMDVWGEVGQKSQLMTTPPLGSVRCMSSHLSNRSMGMVTPASFSCNASPRARHR